MKGLPLLIGFTGPARSGKDSAADFIISHYSRYTKMSFADPMKDMLKKGLGLSHSQLYGNNKETEDPRYGCSARHMMQTIGTEWGRDLISPDVWVQAMEQRLKPCTIIADVRFENEAAMVRRKGVLVHIVGRRGIIDDRHISEHGIVFDPVNGDKALRNNGDLDNFYKQLKTMFIGMIE